MNTTPFKAEEYDNGIRQAIPYYELIIQEVIDLIKTINPNCKNWLDVGSGTGYLVSKAATYFPKVNFYLCDPAEEMIEIAKNNLHHVPNNRLHFIQSTSDQLAVSEMPKMDIVTAILSHHFYSNKEDRIRATQKCFDALSENGLYITVENIRPQSQEGIDIALKKWAQYQIDHGADEASVKNRINRFDKHYFPIELSEHFQVLKNAGFRTYNLFWLSNIQAGLYAIK